MRLYLKNNRGWVGVIGILRYLQKTENVKAVSMKIMELQGNIFANKHHLNLMKQTHKRFRIKVNDLSAMLRKQL